MVTHPVLENKVVRDWLGDIMPVWTLLDERSFFALHHPPSRADAAIQIATNLTRDEINISPMSRNALLLLQAGSIPLGLKLTATGNLSRQVVAQMWDMMEWPRFDKAETLRICKVINEPEFFPLYFLRHLIDSAGLMRKYKNCYRTTPLGKKILEDQRQGSIQALLFDAAFWIADLQYLSRAPLSGWPQHQAGIILWSLSLAARDWSTPARLVRQCAIPFEKIGEVTLDREAYAMEDLIIKPLTDFGMLEVREEQVAGSTYRRNRFYRKTALFDRLLTFNVSLDEAGHTRH